MAFGMSPFPFRFGSRGGGGDPTALTAALLTTLGFATTRTGTALSQKKGTQPSYELVAANAPTFRRSLIDGVAYLSSYAYNSAVPLVSYSNDLTNAAWTKTNVTPVLVAGGGIAGEDRTDLTFDEDNGTVTRTLTRSPANRASLFRIEAPSTNVGDVLVSDGTPDTTILDDDFSSYADTTALLVAWPSNQGATVALETAQISVTRTSSTNDVAVYSFASMLGKLYKVTCDAITNNCRLRVSSAAGGGFEALLISNMAEGSAGGTLVAYFIGTGSTVYVGVGGAPGAPTKTTYDNVVISEVAETTVTPGSFLEIETDAYTAANPQLAIRGDTSGDTAKVYDMQHFEPPASTPVPLHVPPQGATPASLGATLYQKALSVPPAEIDVSVLAFAHPSATVRNETLFEIYLDGSNRAYAYDGSTGLETVAHRVTAGSTFITMAEQPVNGSLFQMDIQISGSVCRARVNGAAWETGTVRALAAYVKLTLGSLQAAIDHWNEPIIALRDNNGQLLGTAGAGFNLKAIDRYIANGYSA